MLENSYVGEIGLQTAIWLLSTSSLQAAYYPRGIVALAMASPLFTYYILRQVSTSFTSQPSAYLLTHARLAFGGASFGKTGG